MISQFGYLLLFGIAAILLVMGMLTIARIMRPDRPGEEKSSVYESGELPSGDARISFNIRFYMVAIVFLLFEVELVLFFPWATVFGDQHMLHTWGADWLWFAGLEMLLFVAILALGLAYVWKKGHLDWLVPKSTPEQYNSPVPPELYREINKKYEKKDILK